ncbi:MAG: YlxR family protein [Cyanobacteria bacterium J06648_16]
MPPPNHRCCVSCRRIAHKDQLLRVVRQHPTRTIQIGAGMGRAAYLCPTLGCLQQAQKKNRLSRALKAPVPSDIYTRLAQRLAAPT